MDDRKKIIAKIAKLKALSECKSGNVNESAVAAAAMTRLMLENRIHVAELEVQTSEVGVHELQVKDRQWLDWKRQLLTVVSEVNGCVIVGRGKPVRTVDCIGTQDDVANVKLLYEFVRDEIERLCIHWQPFACQAKRNNWKLGAVFAVQDRIEAEYKQARSESSQAGLVLIDKRLDEANSLLQKIGFTQAKTKNVEFEREHSQGYAVGSRIDVSRRPVGVLQ